MWEGELIIVRHGDKGKWPVNEQELRAELPPEEAELVLSVLKTEFEGLTETPLSSGHSRKENFTSSKVDQLQHYN